MHTSSPKTDNTFPAVVAEHVSVQYGDVLAVDDVSFEIPAGSIAALIGPNGSGKTTLMRALIGLNPLSAGEVRLFGDHPHDAHGNIGYVPQRFLFDRDFPITVREFMHLARRSDCPPETVEEKIKEVGLVPAILDKRLGVLSGGQLQRVLIAQAILNNPRLLFLDEPSTGIDAGGEQVFYDALRHLNKDHGTTVVMVSHDIGIVSEIVDTVICVNKTLLCAGNPTKLLTQKRLAELYGHSTKMYQHRDHTV